MLLQQLVKREEQIICRSRPRRLSKLLKQISNVHGLIEGATYFTSDSFWPMILGETGIVGLVSIVIVIIRMIKRLQLIKSLDLALYASGLVCISYLLVISMAESAFVNPVAIPLAIVLGLVYGKGEYITG